MDLQNLTTASSSIDGHLQAPTLATAYNSLSSNNTVNPGRNDLDIFDVIVSGIEDFGDKLEDYTADRSLSRADTSAMLSRTSVYSDNLATAVSTGTMSSLLLMALAYIVGVRPGHEEGRYLPVYVSDHYTERTSVHPFDPYSWTHVSHGIMGHMAVMAYGYLAGAPDPDTTTFWQQGGGFLLTLATGAAWEILENTDFIINRFRENSGPSADYRGDSYVNVVGDVVSVGVGYMVSEWGTRALGIWFPVALLATLEGVLAWLIRDNYFLMVQQLVFPSVAVLNWQLQIIPEDQRATSTGLVALPPATSTGLVALPPATSTGLVPLPSTGLVALPPATSTGLVPLPPQDIHRSQQGELPVTTFQKGKAFRKFIDDVWKNEI